MSVKIKENRGVNEHKINELKENPPDNTLSLQRWRILKEALLGGRSSALTCQSTASVRRFKTFDLLQTQLLPHDGQQLETSGEWYDYTAASIPDFRMTIRHLPGTVKAETLLGFNNTGNVCVWPAEEILTYYCLNNLQLFRDKSVCELGGGMTCLAGVAVGVSCDVKDILLTDGNEESVTNLENIINRNTASFRNSDVTSRVLRWGCGPLDADLLERFDLILCADCLFFEDGRQDLVDTIHSLLKPQNGLCQTWSETPKTRSLLLRLKCYENGDVNVMLVRNPKTNFQGEAILFAPRRGDTFDKFVDLASEKFEMEVKENYDDVIWDLHCKLKAKGHEHYDPDIHYPLYLHLLKIPASRETSMER